jgi:hypothetical protein
MKNMKYKLFVIIAVLALAVFFIFVYCSNESEHETINEDATRVEDSDESRTEVATVSDKSSDAEPSMSYSTLAASPSYELVSKTYAKDIDKVMKSVSGLSTSGKTVLGGRRGEPSSLTSGGTMKLLAASTKSEPSGFYSVSGSGGIGDGLAGLLGGSSKGLATKAKAAPKSFAKTASRSYDMAVARDEPSARKRKSSSVERVRVSERYISSDDDDDDDESAYRKSKRRGGKNSGRKSGLLTAGEWNDLSNWGFWTDILDDDNYSGKTDYWEFYPENLVVVKVVDNNNVGIANVSVELFNSNSREFTTKTDNAGYAYCWINLFEEGNRKIKAKDFSLKVDGDWVNKSLKLTTKQDQKLNVNVVVDDSIRHPKARADVAFIVDATGSMDDEIKFLKSDLSYIIDHASSESKVALRTAALFYRDEGDVYLTRANDFTNDASETQDFVSKQDADGGGDYAEAVHSALEASLQDLSWNASARSRIAFLILDAPAHHESDVIESLQKSIKRYAKHGIKLIPVAASGIDKDTEFMLRFFDVATGGTYVFLTDDSGIGNSHIKASVGDHKVEYLTDLIIRLIKKYVK